MSLNLSTPDDSALGRTVDIGSDDEDEKLPRECSVDYVFELDRCEQWIRQKQLQKVALQFPDSLLARAPAVAAVLEERLEQRMAILGDTSYGECCVDEVAAAHVGADGVVHFGRACLTPTQRLPVLYVYTRLPLDVKHLSGELTKFTAEGDGTSVFLFYDVRYHHAFSANKELFNQYEVCEPVAPDSGDSRIKCGRLCKSPAKPSDIIVFCGSSERSRLTLALTFSQCRHYNYRPSKRVMEGSYPNGSSKEIMRRSYLIEKVKDSSRLGILVGTLGVSRYRDVIDRVQEVIKASGKKSYVFLVGKPNVAKLANFPEIDTFVLVACPETSLVQSREFMQPVVTPLELDLALNAARRDYSWTDFSADFKDVLPGQPLYKEFVTDSSDGDVSLLTGKARTMNLGGEESAANECQALVAQDTRVGLVHSGGGGEFLVERSWRGLEQKLGETPVEKAIQGPTGIASGYRGEGAES